MRAEQRCNILHRIVCFQIGGLVSDQGIAERVRFIKRVSGKRFDQGVNLFRQFAGESFGIRAGDKNGFLFLDHRGDFFTHRLPENIGFPQAVAAELPDNKKYLLLVDDHAVGFLQVTG